MTADDYFQLDSSAPEASIAQPFPAPAWAPHVQAGEWGRLGIVDPERALRLMPEDIINQVQQKREESYRASQHIRATWDRYDDLYYLRNHDGLKEDWQADIQVPSVWDTIRVLLSLCRSGLFDLPRYFDLEDRVRSWDNPVLSFIRHWMTLSSEQSQLREASLGMWEDAFRLGSGCMGLDLDQLIAHRPRVESMPIYGTPEEAFQAVMMGQPTAFDAVIAEPQARAQLSWRRRSPRHVFPDAYASSFYEGKYTVEEFELDEEDVEDRWRAGLYDSIADIGEPVRMTEAGEYGGSRGRHLELTESATTNRRRHLIQEFTGNIHDPEGRIVAKNWCVTVVNRRAIVRMGPNPLWSGKQRYVWSTPVPYAGRVWGRSLVEVEADVQEHISELMNLVIDDSRYSVLSAFRMDTNLSDEPVNPSSIEPGRIYYGRTGMIEKLQFASQANIIWPTITQLSQVGDRSTKVHEWIDGTPSSRGRASATEVKTKTSAGSAFLDTMMKGLEEDDLERALDLTYEYTVQFGGDTTDPELQALVIEWGGPQVLMDPVARFKLLDVPFKFKARGVSMLMSRQDVIARLMQLFDLHMRLGVPPADVVPALYMGYTALGFDPTQFGLPPDPQPYQQYLEQQRQMGLLQAMQQNGGGGGGPAGVSVGASQSPGGSSLLPPSPDATDQQVQAQSTPAPG